MRDLRLWKKTAEELVQMVTVSNYSKGMFEILVSITSNRVLSLIRHFMPNPGRILPILTEKGKMKKMSSLNPCPNDHHSNAPLTVLGRYVLHRRLVALVFGAARPIFGIFFRFSGEVETSVNCTKWLDNKIQDGGRDLTFANLSLEIVRNEAKEITIFTLSCFKVCINMRAINFNQNPHKFSVEFLWK